MKFIWEKEDVTGHQGRAGAVIAFKQFSDETKELWMLGYRVAEKGNEYGIVSLSDGMFVGIGTADDMVQHLNTTGAIPKVKIPKAGQYIADHF
jgi:hypothetical protein